MGRFYDTISDFIFVEDAPQKADVIFVPGGNYPDAAVHAAELYRQGFAPYILPSGKYSISVGKFVLPEEGNDAEIAQKAEKPADTRKKVSDESAVNEEKITYAKETNKEKVSDVKEANEAKDADVKKKDKENVTYAYEEKRRTEGGKAKSYETEFAYLHDILVKNGVDEAAILKEDQATFTYQNAIFSRQVLEKAGVPVKRAILCCQAFHARRALLYYQEQFPETEFVVCPVVTRGIARDTWMRTAEGIDTVLGEVERCGSQFHEILREHRMREISYDSERFQK